MMLRAIQWMRTLIIEEEFQKLDYPIIKTRPQRLDD